MKLYKLFLQETKKELDYLRDYHNFSERFIKEKVKKLEAWVDEQTPKLTPEEKDVFFDFYCDDYWELSQNFPNIVRGSLLLICMALLEHQLTDLCHSLQRTKKYAFVLNDFSDRGITRTQIYLKKAANIKFPDDTEQWSNILIYRVIRNAIAHNDYEIKCSDDLGKVMKFSENHSSIQFDNAKVILGDTFCLEVIDNIEKFLDVLYQDKEFQ